MLVTSSCLALGAEGKAGGGDDWPRFRGPGGVGSVSWAEAPTHWNRKSGEGILWDVPVALPGESSPVVCGKRVFLTGGTPEKCDVSSFDADTGKLLWRKEFESRLRKPAPAAGDEPKILFAAATPVTDGKRIYAIFGTGDVVALDLDGRVDWTRSLGQPANDYGHSSSLEVWRDLLLVQMDQGKAEEGLSRLLALDAATGRTSWETKREMPACWSSPIVIHAAGRDQVILCGEPWVTSYDPSGGAEIWRARCLGGEVVPSPVFAGGLVVAASVDGTLCAIRPDGKGDVTATHVAWAVEEDLPGIASPVSRDDLVFTLTTGGLLACCRLKDGKRIWQQDLDTSFQASPEIAGRHLYLLSDRGEVFILEVGTEYRLLGRVTLGEACQASPAFQSGRIYIRTKGHLVAAGKRGE